MTWSQSDSLETKSDPVTFVQSKTFIHGFDGGPSFPSTCPLQPECPSHTFVSFSSLGLCTRYFSCLEHFLLFLCFTSPHPSGVCLIVTSSQKPSLPTLSSLVICSCYAFPSSQPPYVSHASTQHLYYALSSLLDYKLLEGRGMSILLTFHSQFQLYPPQKDIQ